ncbi:hypothetical protein [Hyunsoonleella pacifica]|uniref:Uncharacterized protein n=1 Tax=Hyunsoonleella pacifica TaxID=1080224 RepID=A0A4Q9FWX1_9FLAO|nr:hypothetical protein [Hyunsoonleella pacifica]TBN18852.1 hypothetical protein EYD46_01950 [Hyunsoonleella pacifica]GGD05340.1 hypothetical protein GCM10011368_03900 [Hyunsoonleella pacifica]
MNRKIQKGFKPFVFKITIVIMIMCYIFGPLHNEISNVLHVLSHQIEMSATFTSHADNSRFNHQITHHTLQFEAHQHEILELFNKIIEASNLATDNENPLLVKQKIDKHIRTKKEVKYMGIYTYNLQSNYSSIIECTLNGYVFAIFEPPKRLA